MNMLCLLINKILHLNEGDHLSFQNEKIIGCSVKIYVYSVIKNRLLSNLQTQIYLIALYVVVFRKDFIIYSDFVFNNKSQSK